MSSQSFLCITVFQINKKVGLHQFTNFYIQQSTIVFKKSQGNNYILHLPWICRSKCCLNPSNAELNPIRHLLALVGARHIVHVSGTRFNA